MSELQTRTPEKTRLDRTLTIPEMDVRGKKKDYPSINDYYKAAARGDKPIQYQHGLSNYSSVLLGDDRISFKKSLSQDVYKLEFDIEQNNDTEKENTGPVKTYQQRKEDYAEANSIVGLGKIHEMEQMMRDKLQQRTKTGPFQLRKTFKYFDRDGSGGIDFSEFQRAMELMGFQFTEVQQLALFARYDESCTGEVDYNDFVEKVMESDFKVVQSSVKKNLELVSSAMSSEKWKNSSALNEEDEDSSDTDEDELERFRRREIKRMFDIVDKDGSGFIDKREIKLLLKRLGKDFSDENVEEFLRKIDSDRSGMIEFDEFYKWYKLSMGS